MIRAALFVVASYILLIAGAIGGGASLAALFHWLGVRLSL